jgi:hypothetical protein
MSDGRDGTNDDDDDDDIIIIVVVVVVEGPSSLDDAYDDPR